jgi:hypothetical protein
MTLASFCKMWDKGTSTRELPMTNVKQMSREDLKKIGIVEALNEILERNTRLAAARKVIRELKTRKGA